METRNRSFDYMKLINIFLYKFEREFQQTINEKLLHRRTKKRDKSIWNEEKNLNKMINRKKTKILRLVLISSKCLKESI